MEIVLSSLERQSLEQAAATERRVRVWRRYRAVLLLGEGQSPEAVAQLLACSRSSVYGWAAAWRRGGVEALRGQPAGGGVARLEERAGPLLEELLAADPQAHGHRATGWTVPLLRTELAAGGIMAGERTIRRALHRLGWRWKRPKFVLGRPDPAYGEKSNGLERQAVTAGTAGRQGVRRRTSALRIVKSLCMQAVRASFFGLPSARSRA
jgi:transposase